MVLSKHERTLRTLELKDEPDIVPIHNLGFEPTGISHQNFLKSEQKLKFETTVKNKFLNVSYNITEQRFWNADCHNVNPFNVLKYYLKKAPPEYPDYAIDVFTGRLFKLVKQMETNLTYPWYIDGYFTTPEIVHSYWDKYGTPSEIVIKKSNISKQAWDAYVDAVSPYFYPLLDLSIAMHEYLFTGMTITKAAYYMRKKPQFIHEVMKEFSKANIEIIKRYGEIGVDMVFYYDDLGYKGSTIFSIDQFKEFILPYYKQIYQECKKHGMFIIQHSCGYIDKLLPYMVDAGLNGIQALEPAAGVDLAHLKETLGDKVAFLGGIDASNILNFGTPKDVEEEVKRCIKAAARGGGYFAGASHNILNAPWENILALRTAIEKYRKYPLKFN
jgi:hypothetical protein